MRAMDKKKTAGTNIFKSGEKKVATPAATPDKKDEPKPSTTPRGGEPEWKRRQREVEEEKERKLKYVMLPPLPPLPPRRRRRRRLRVAPADCRLCHTHNARSFCCARALGQRGGRSVAEAPGNRWHEERLNRASRCDERADTIVVFFDRNKDGRLVHRRQRR